MQARIGATNAQLAMALAKTPFQWMEALIHHDYQKEQFTIEYILVNLTPKQKCIELILMDRTSCNPT